MKTSAKYNFLLWAYLVLFGLCAQTFAGPDSLSDLLPQDENYGSQVADGQNLKLDEIHHRLLGLSHLDPMSTEFYVRSYFIKEISKSISTLPTINESQVEEIMPAFDTTKGGGNGGVYFAKYQGKDVFVKVKAPGFSMEHFLIENRNMLYLNQLGLGVEYLGVTEINFRYGPQGKMEKNYGIVMKKLDGELLDQYNQDLLRAESIQDLARQVVLMWKAGIYPLDFQCGINEEGKITLIDFGWYDIEGMLDSEKGIRYLFRKERTERLDFDDVLSLFLKDIKERKVLSYQWLPLLSQFLDLELRRTEITSPIGPFIGRPVRLPDVMREVKRAR